MPYLAALWHIKIAFIRETKLKIDKTVLETVRISCQNMNSVAPSSYFFSLSRVHKIYVNYVDQVKK